MSRPGEPVGPERERLLPQLQVVVVPPQVEQDHRALRDRFAAPCQVLHRDLTDERCERVETTDLVREGLGELVVAVGQPLAVVRPAVQSVRGMGDEPAHRCGRADDVEQLDVGELGRQLPPVGVAMARCHVERGLEDASIRPDRTALTSPLNQASRRPRARRARQCRGPGVAKPSTIAIAGCGSVDLRRIRSERTGCPKDAFRRRWAMCCAHPCTSHPVLITRSQIDTPTPRTQHPWCLRPGDVDVGTGFR